MTYGLDLLRSVDVLIGGLCRGVPATCRTRVLLRREDATLIQECAPYLLGSASPDNDFVGLISYDLGDLVVPHVLKYIRGWFEVLFDFNEKVPTLLDSSFESTYRMLLGWSIEDFVPNAKYYVVYPMARFLKNPLPTKPPGVSSPILFSGRLKRFIKSRLVSLSESNSRLFQGILQGVKRATEVVPESFVQKSLEKHRATLTKKTSFRWGWKTDFDEKVKQLTRGFRSAAKIYESSPSASIEYSRSKGGQRQFILDTLGQKGDELLSMKEIRPGKVIEVRRPYGSMSISDVTLPLFNQAESLDIDSTPALYVEKRFNEPHWARSTKNEELLKVAVSAVLEPLKVRLITKGESLPYWFSKFFQKDMWSFLQRLPQFQLIGKPLTSDNLDWLRAKRDSLEFPFAYWVSGDYAGATDALKLAYTEGAFEGFLDRTSMPERYKEALRSVLYEQTLTYPKTSGLLPVKQENGQLMGSPLSFPILCVVNFVAYWLSLEEYLGRSVAMEELPVLINGDDILFPSNPDHYKIWLTWIDEVGFSLSLGKNYCSAKFLTVNSVLYYDKESSFSRVPYLNAGLLTGQSKLNSDQEKKRRKPLWANYNDTVHDACSPLRAHARFIHYNLSEVRDLTNDGEFNLFSHWSLGGLGFKRPKGLDVDYTNFQQKLGSYLRAYLLQPIEGRGIRTSHFWKGIVCKNTRLTEPVKETYKEIVASEEMGPLRKGVVVYEEAKAPGELLTQDYSLMAPEFQIKQLPKAIIEGVRRSGGRKTISPESLEKFDVRFLEVQRLPKITSDGIMEESFQENYLSSL